MSGKTTAITAVEMLAVCRKVSWKTKSEGAGRGMGGDASSEMELMLYDEDKGQFLEFRRAHFRHHQQQQ